MASLAGGGTAVPQATAGSAATTLIIAFNEDKAIFVESMANEKAKKQRLIDCALISCRCKIEMDETQQVLPKWL